MNIVLTVHENVLLTWIPHTHEILRTRAHGNDDLYRCGSMVHSGEENLEPIGKDAKGILDHTAYP